MKSTWKCTETWVTLITNAVGIAVLCGAINAGEGEEIGNALKAIAGAVISIATTLGYIKSRVDLKCAKIEAVSYAHDKGQDHEELTSKMAGVGV